MSEGYVYIMTNPAYVPDLIMIGRSTDPEIRARSLYQPSEKKENGENFPGAGVPARFEVAYQKYVMDYIWVEKTLHKLLSDVRYNPERNFFKLNVDVAIEILDLFLNKYEFDSSISEFEFSELSQKINELLIERGYGATVSVQDVSVVLRDGSSTLS